MQFNIPIMSDLTMYQNVLLAGMGGGFDVYCALPIYFELLEQGCKPHLASLSFSDIIGVDDDALIRLTPTCVGITADYELPRPDYFPELHMANWFRKTRQEDVTVWSFHNMGIPFLREAYHALVERLNIDCIVLIDGGVDSIMRGNEQEVGTIIEDFSSLIAVNELDTVKTKYLVCTGLGAELHVTYEQVFENISALIEADAFYGSCSVTKQMPAYLQYEDAVLYAQVQRGQSPSVINSSIISAARGQFGDYHLTSKTHGSELKISPLMSQYWFFDLATVAEHNHLIDALSQTESMFEIYFILRNLLPEIKRRSKPKLF